jgi:hypothetical protein
LANGGHEGRGKIARPGSVSGAMHGGASAGAKYTRHVLIGLKQPNGMLLKIGTFRSRAKPRPGPAPRTGSGVQPVSGTAPFAPALNSFYLHTPCHDFYVIIHLVTGAVTTYTDFSCHPIHRRGQQAGDKES